MARHDRDYSESKSPHQRFLQLRDVHVQCLVHFLYVQYNCILNAVQKLPTSHADFVLPEVPIKEHPGRDDPLVSKVTVKTVVLPIVLAQLGLTKYCRISVW